jgi:hypothetical protein
MVIVPEAIGCKGTRRGSVQAGKSMARLGAFKIPLDVEHMF